MEDPQPPRATAPTPRHDGHSCAASESHRPGTIVLGWCVPIRARTLRLRGRSSEVEVVAVVQASSSEGDPITPFASLREVAWNDAWFRAAPGLSETHADALLVEADAVREPGDARFGAAVACYAALLPRPTGDAQLDRARTQFVLRHADAKDVHERALHERMVAAAKTEEAADASRLSAAVCSGAMGELEAARHVILDVLPRVRGRGSRLELKALLNLALVLQLQDHGLAALLLNGRARRLAERLGLGEPRAFALANSLPLLEDLALEEELRAALRELELVLPDVNPEDRPSLRGHALRFAVLLAVEQGELGEAHATVGVLSTLPAASAHSPHGTAFEALARASYLAASGDAAGALRAVDAALERQDLPAPLEPRLRAQRCALLIERGQVQEARADARVRLAQFVAAFPTLSAETACRTAMALIDAPWGAEDGARSRMAARLAADAALESIRTFQAEAWPIEELAEPRPEEWEILNAVRRHALRRHRLRCRVLAAQIADDLSRGGPWAQMLGAGDGETVKVCAWCRRARTSDGRWVALLPYVAGLPPYRATHGMCDACRRSAMDG